MKSLLLLFTLSFQPSCLKTDIIIVADMSTSVHGWESYIADAGLAFTERFELDEDGVKIGAIAFAGHAWYVSRLTSDKDYLTKELSAIRRSEAVGSTDMANALYLAQEEFEENGRSDYQKVLIIISDGDAQDKETVMIASRELRNAGITIFAILVRSPDEKPEFMQAISNMYVASNYELLAEEFKKLDVCF